MFCARFGGDEFVVFGKEETGTIDFEKRLIKKLDLINSDSQKPYGVSASIGTVVSDPKDGMQIMDVIQMADNKMYIKKKNKKAAR